MTEDEIMMTMAKLERDNKFGIIRNEVTIEDTLTNTLSDLDIFDGLDLEDITIR